MVKWLHPITVQQEVSIDVEVATIVAIDFNSKTLHHRWLIEPLVNVVKPIVTKWIVATLYTDIIWILTCNSVSVVRRPYCFRLPGPKTNLSSDKVRL